jgi:hypothetical protein
MSDNFGPSQSRVLSVDNRSLDQVVFQDRRVPLTSEWNLINQISDFKSSEAVKVNQPSGWIHVGDIKDSGATSPTGVTANASTTAAEERSKSGDVITSLTYNSNRFKFSCREATNVAVVNGWPIIVQNPGSHPLVPAGQNDTDSFIELTLPPATGSYRYDIVFLEVWRKLVGASDSIFPYGNVKSTPFSDNEIVWDVIGAETTKRVQIQYRIRTFPSESYGNLLNTELYPDGLGGTNVRPIGGNAEGAYVTTSGYHFKNAGPRDSGLYIAGDGSSTAKSLLNTVDGYVYAVPMFLIYRRAAGISYSPNNVHGSNVTRADAISGKVSDRPDGKYSDVIVADDIIDARHQLLTSGSSVNASIEKSFRKLITGDLKTTVGQGYTTSGQKLVCTGGSECIKVEQLNGSSSTLPNIGSGVSSGLHRRAYSKAGLQHDHNIIEVPINGSTWKDGNISIPSFLPSTYGTIISIDGFYSDDTWDTLTDISATTSTITIGQNSNIKGETWTLYMEFTFEYESSDSGFYDVPKEFLEAGKYIYQPIAVRDRNLPVRYDNNKQLITDSTIEDYVSYKENGCYTKTFNFGHDLIYHKITADGSTVSVSTKKDNASDTKGKLYRYTILGVKSVQVKSGSSYGDKLNFSVTRVASASSVDYNISALSGINPGDTLAITLITGSGDNETDSMKFFELNKQGRGVIDVFEMIEVVTADTSLMGSEQLADLANGVYWVDTGDKPIIAIGSRGITSGSEDFGLSYGFKVDGSSSENEALLEIIPPGGGLPETDVNNYLPILSSSQFESNMLPTRVKLRVSGAAFTDQIRVPVLVHSYVPASESAYNFYYRFVPYQGILSSTEIRGRIEKEGPAVVSSLGAGQIKNFTYSNGTVKISSSSNTVTKVSGSSWENYIRAGDLFIAQGSPYAYEIKSVDTGFKLTLKEDFVESTLSGSAFSVIRLDTPETAFSNVIDRMPSFVQEDYKGRSEDMVLGGVSGSLILLGNKVNLQSPLDSEANDFQLGLQQTSGGRGRYEFVLTDGDNSLYKLGKLTPYVKYGNLDSWTSVKGSKKVFQAYLFNKSYEDDISRYRDLTGRLYMLVISGESNTTDTEVLLDAFSANDTIDLFELCGRPIIKTR